MSKSQEELREDLRYLEEGYPGQPTFIQQNDLCSINELRAQLGMPLVDGDLVEIAEQTEKTTSMEALPSKATAAREVDAKENKDLRRARVIYERYLEKAAELERHQNYADLVVKATEGVGMTPVRPLATMGKNGGPLLCDYCHKPIVLEGGSFHGKTADVAWKGHPSPPADWTSWILGGLVVELQTNSTLRIYHGYVRQPRSCCSKASRVDQKAASSSSKSWFENQSIVMRLVKQELLPKGSAEEQRDLAFKILDTVFGHEPGFGINGP